MPIERTSIYGTSSIGVFCYANDFFALIPENAPSKFERLMSEVLEVNVLRCKVCDSVIIGVFVAGNSKGLLLPRNIRDEEYELIKSLLKRDLVVEILPSRNTAIGNLILANDHAALVYEGFEKGVIKMIEDVLDVEVFKGRIAGFTVVGSVAVVTNKGLLVHPQTEQEELNWLSELFKVENADVGTVNRGKPYIRAGLIVNSKGALVGDDTTGPELMHIETIFGLAGGRRE